MISGAGHDSVFTSKRVPTSMIFVPCLDGISHNPAEYCSPEDWLVAPLVSPKSCSSSLNYKFDRRCILIFALAFDLELLTYSYESNTKCHQ